jgi:uncharacterized protein YijF (DUF1287 family)
MTVADSERPSTVPILDLQQPLPALRPFPHHRRSFRVLLVAAICYSTMLAGQNSPARQQFLHHLVSAAVERTHHVVRYEPAYVRIPYPGGDVPADTGVCTDEIIRSYRAVGVDLQKEVHEDMVANFREYPRSWKWILARPDSFHADSRVPRLTPFGLLTLNSSDLPRGMLRVFHSFERRCFERKTICPMCWA